MSLLLFPHSILFLDVSQKTGLRYNSQGGLTYNGGEEAPSDTLSYTNKHKLSHSHDSAGVGGHGPESS